MNLRVLHGARLKFYFILVDYRYPKDAEKHLLAVQSGLTRSQVPVTFTFNVNNNVFDCALSCLTPVFWVGEQVSNWFINARVRLWKPMIEEMYAELNDRNYCRNEGRIESSHTMLNQRFNV